MGISFEYGIKFPGKPDKEFKAEIKHILVYLENTKRRGVKDVENQSSYISGSV